MPTTLTTTSGSFTVPDYTDPADVVQWLRALFGQLGNDVLPSLAGGGVSSGTLLARPKAAKAGRLYRVTGDVNAGALFLDDGTEWRPVGTVGQLVQLFALAAGEVPLSVTAAASQSASLQQWLSSAGSVLARIGATGRLHGPGVALQSATAADVPATVTGAASQSGDLMQLLASGGAVLSRFSPRGQYVPPIAPVTTFGLDTAANGYRPLTITVTASSAAGAPVLSTATLTYDATSGNLTRIVTVADGRTVQRDLTYDANGNLATAVESITAGV